MAITDEQRKAEHEKLAPKIRDDLLAMGINAEFADKCYKKWMHLDSIYQYRLRRKLLINISQDVSFMEIPFSFLSGDDDSHLAHNCLLNFGHPPKTHLVAVIELLPERRL